MEEAFDTNESLFHDALYVKESVNGEEGLVPAVTPKVLKHILNKSAASISLYSSRETNPLPIKKVLGVNLVTLPDLLAYKWVSRHGRSLMSYVGHVHFFKDGSAMNLPCKGCTAKHNLGDMGTGTCSAVEGRFVDGVWTFDLEDN